MTIMFKGEYHKIVILVLSCFGNEKNCHLFVVCEKDYCF